VVLARGATLQAACDAVGVNRRTGRRWRQATGGRIPRKRPEPSGRYLGLDERLQIADLRLAGVGVRAIGIQLGRSPSTISRELTRNSLEPGVSGRVRGGGKYVPYAAQKRAELRGRRPKASKFDDAELASVVQAKLCVKWSPRSRSASISLRISLAERRCRCATRRSIRRCSCRAAGICVPICTSTCAPDERCAARAGPPSNEQRRSRTWS